MKKTNRILPILFNTDMVQAILDGRKTATRRVIKPQPDEKHNYPLGFITDSTEKKEIGSFAFDLDRYGCSFQLAKPPYRVGNILYVRETWHKYKKRVGKGESCHIAEFYGYKASIANSEDSDEPWKPSIHMPKEAARIWLKVTDVRVERLQDITEEQAQKEGCSAGHDEYKGSIFGEEYYNEWTAIDDFKDVWDSTIKKPDNSWNANPWVWVIEFERIEKPEDV